MTPPRIAFIGAGVISRMHLRVIAESGAGETVAIADPMPAAEKAANAHGARWFADYVEMLDAVRPDGVIVATPNQLHVPAALACVARGIPVLVEKPVADTLAAARELIAASAAADVPILVGHHRRHNPILRRAAEIVGGGMIGRVTAVTATWLNRKPDDYFDVAWRREPGGGPVLINAIHEIDVLRMLCGEIDTVQAATANGARGFAVEDTAAAVIRFESGALGSLIVSDAVSSPSNWELTSRENPMYPIEDGHCLEITGTKGSLTVPSLELAWRAPCEAWTHALMRRSMAVPLADPYVAQIRHFARVIRREEPPVLDAASATRTLAATLAIHAAAKTGGAVRVADMMAGE